MSEEYDLSEYLKKSNPVGTIVDVASELEEEYDLSEYLGAGMRGAMQGSKVAGSYLMDMLAPLDKPRGAVEGARVAAFETPSVTDERSLGQRIAEGAREGFSDPQFPDVPIPERFEDTTIGKVGEVGGGIAASIMEDPLTYGPGAVVSIPYKIIKGLLGAAGKTGPVKSVLQSGPVSNVLEALNIYTGDGAKAQKIINDVRLESRGVEIRTGRQLVETNRELERIASEAGVSVGSLKAAILNASETGDMTKVANLSTDAVKYAGDDIKFYEDLIKTEQAAGLDTADITRVIDPDTQLTQAQLLDVEKYVPHVSAKHDTFSSKIKKLLTGNRGFQQGRTIAGTIDEINAAKGTTFFMDDPAVLKMMRLRWSNQAMLGDRAVAKAGEQFGTLIGKTPKGSKGLFDVNGNPIPDDWVKIKDHAFPPGIGKPLIAQYKLLKSPKATGDMIKIYDEVQNWWKKYSLASRPAWHTRNAFSNFWNNYFLGGLTNPVAYGEAAAIQKAMQIEKGSIVSRLDTLTGANKVDPNFLVSGTGMTRQEIFDEAIKRGVYEAGMYGQDLGEAALRQSNIPGATDWKGINKAFAAGKAVENNARLALFIDSIRKGTKGVKGRVPVSEEVLDNAAMNVRGSLFDYSDLSEFERRKMKRLMPFYTWTRKNIPAQLAGLVKRPDRANKLNIIVGNVQKDVAKLDDNDIEDWVKGQFPIFLNAKDSEDYYTFFTAMSYLPTAELERVLGDPKNLSEWFKKSYKGGFDMVSPILKLPFEIILNYDSFKQSYIDYSQTGYGPRGKGGEGVFPFRADTTRGSEEFLGMRVTPKEKKILSSLVLLGEVDRLNPWNVFGEAENTATGDIPKKSWAGVTRKGEEMLESARWVRAILGARLYKREKGRGEVSRVSNEYKMLKTLEAKLKSYKAMQNEELREHLMGQIEQILGGL
jgi:hypothetical protein